MPFVTSGAKPKHFLCGVYIKKAANGPGENKREGYKWILRQMAITHVERFENGVVSSVDTLNTPYETRRKEASQQTPKDKIFS